MQNVTPKLGTITDKNGKKYPNSYQIDKLEPLVKQGLIDKGVITKDKNVVLTLVGDKINITII